MDLSGRFALRVEFANIDAALPDRVAVSNAGADHFHRPAETEDGVGPWCMQRKSGYGLVETERAVAHGIAPCRDCYGAVFEYLARQSDSPVEHRDSEPDLTDFATNAIEGALPDGGGNPNPSPRPSAPLTAPTETVRIKSGSSKVYHAPANSGTLCGETGEGYRSVQREAVEGHYRPCERCFDLDDRL